jgi:hypothetical protein
VLLVLMPVLMLKLVLMPVLVLVLVPAPVLVLVLLRDRVRSGCRPRSAARAPVGRPPAQAAAATSARTAPSSSTS